MTKFKRSKSPVINLDDDAEVVRQELTSNLTSEEKSKVSLPSLTRAAELVREALFQLYEMSLEKPDAHASLQHASAILGKFQASYRATLGHQTGRKKSGTEELAEMQPLREGIVAGFKEICIALIDYATKPSAERSSLAAFLGQINENMPAERTSETGVRKDRKSAADKKLH